MRPVLSHPYVLLIAPFECPWQVLYITAHCLHAGIMLFRNKSMDFVNRWISVIESDDKIWDQNAFNDLFRV